MNTPGEVSVELKWASKRGILHSLDHIYHPGRFSLVVTTLPHAPGSSVSVTRYVLYDNSDNRAEEKASI